jgi:hypothetical protein
MPPATIAGSIAQSGVLINGAVRVNGSNCLDRLTTIGLTGTLTKGNVALTSTSADGQVITFGGCISKKVGFPYTFTGTYAINDGYANGDQGNITLYGVDSITGYWAGNLTTAEGETIHWDTQLALGSTSEGSFGLFHFR